MYLVFYSKYCAYSRQFINTLQKSDEDRFFTKISVDNKRGKEYAVKEFNIKKVPTIIVNQSVYEGVDSLKWLQSKIKGKNTVASMNTRMNKLAIKPKKEVKVPLINAYEYEIDSADIGCLNNTRENNLSIQGQMDSNFNIQEFAGAIHTPEETDGVVEKDFRFKLPEINITNGSTEIKGKTSGEKSSQMESEFEKMMSLRKKQELGFFPQRQG